MKTKKTQKQSIKTDKSETIRVSSPTKDLLQKVLDNANKKNFGRKIFPDQIISLALSLITPECIQKLQDDSLSNEDRKEQLRQLYIKKCGKITKDEFTGFMMTTAFFDFLNEQGQGLSLTA